MVSIRAAGRRRRERGQTLVFALGFLAATVAAFLIAFDTGQLVAQKQRLINAADAAAYGGAVWQARTLNFQAYLNRGVVANEVALAQAVSLRSWSDYLGVTLTNINRITQFIPYLGQATTALQRAWQGVDRAVQPAMQAVEAIAAAVTVVLARAEPAIDALGYVAAEDVARETLRAAGSGVRASAAAPVLLGENALEWARFSRGYAGAERDRLKRVVLDSRDGFTSTRNARFAPPIPAPLRLEKRGGTDLIGFDTWRGLDTLSLHQRPLLFGRFRERVPLGWGGAENTRAATAQRGEHGGSWRTNPAASRLATNRIGTRSGGRARSYAGLQTTRDLGQPDRRDERALTFLVEAERGAGDVATADRALGVSSLPAPDGTLHALRANLHGDRHVAISAARVTFARPQPRADARREYPSLYSPYWQARLASVPARARLTAAATRRIADPYAVVAP